MCSNAGLSRFRRFRRETAHGPNIEAHSAGVPEIRYNLRSLEPLGAIDRPMDKQVEIVDVGPRDGLQSQPKLLDTDTKVALIERLIDAGIKEDDIDNVTAFEAIGCDACTNGYKGRAGIFQVLPVSDKLISMILKSAGQDELESQAIEEGVLTLRQSALKKFATGQLSLAEVERVTNL